MKTMFWMLVAASLQATPTDSRDAVSLLARGRTMRQFLDSVTSQHDLWIKNVSQAKVEPNMVERLSRVSMGLSVLVVAEDWCPDSANTVPYLASLAALAHVELRIVNRVDGDGLMKRHPSPDGRSVTPTVVLIRDGVDAGAWIEHPSFLQMLFESMATNPEAAQRFGQRQTWYDSDQGRSTVAEFVSLAERTAAGK
jgi:hypothetical protein